MFNDPPMSDFEKERIKQENEARIHREKMRREDVALKPEFVAEELYRAYRWAEEQESEMRTQRAEALRHKHLAERAEYLERWMLRYMAIKVQALSGLASVSPEIRQRLSKG